MPRKKRHVVTKWRGKKIYLPNIVISSELRRPADDAYFGRTKPKKPRENESEWNPSWSDDDGDKDKERYEYYDDLFRIVKQPRKSKKRKKEKNEVAEPISLEITNESGRQENSSSRNTPSPKKTRKSPEKAVTTSQRKAYKKEELFKNWLGGQGPKDVDDKSTTNEGTERRASSSSSSASLLEKRKSDVKIFDTTQEETLNKLECKECGKVFTKNIHLTLHQKIQCNTMGRKTNFKLDNSSAGKSTDSEFRHDTHQPNMELPDTVSSSESSKKNKTESHEFVCSQCDRRFGRSNQLKLHKQLCKSKITDVPVFEVYFCEACRRSFNRSNQLKLHKRICKSRAIITPVPDVDEYSCEKCNRSFQRKNQLKIHKAVCKQNSNLPSEESPDVEEYSCEKCNRSFQRKNQLKIHKAVCKLNSNLPSEESPALDKPEFSCKNCSRRFERQIQLKFHKQLCKATPATPLAENKENHVSSSIIANTLESPLMFTCDDCGSQFKLQHYLNMHRKRHFKHCKQCSVAIHESEFGAHVMNCCPKKEPTSPVSSSSECHINEDCKCTTCGIICADSDKLMQHLMFHEFSIESFEYINLGQLKRIMPFFCECGSRFSNEMDWFLHLEIKHEMHSNPTFYKITAEQQPPINPYVRLPFSDKQPADSKWERLKASIIRTQSKLKKRQQNLFNDLPPLDCYKCEICKRSFQNESMFHAHKGIHAKDPTFKSVQRPGRFRYDIPYQSVYKCKICNKKYNKRNPYISHIGAHKREEMYKCTTCDRKFQSESAFKDHMNRHAADPEYKSPVQPRIRLDIPIQDEYTCETCGEKYTSRNMFLMHLREEKLKCKICGRKHISDAALKSHMERHSDPSYVPEARGRGMFRSDIPIQDEYTCETCGEKFSKRHDFLVHLREEKFKCTICDRRFPSDAILKAHMERHSDPTYVPGVRGSVRTDIPFQDEYTCETCGEKFKKRNEFLAHLREEKYKCTICNRGFPSESMLKTHLERHSNPNYVPGVRGVIRSDVPFQDEYTCETCGKMFVKRNDFLLHLREEKFKCKICQRGFLSEGLLTTHMERHSDPSYVPGRRGRGRFRSDIPMQSTYTCDVCQKSFDGKERNYFLIHMAQHKREAKYACTMCEHKFHTAQQLQFHVEKHSDPNYVPRHPRSHKSGKISILGNSTGSVVRKRRLKRVDIPVGDTYNCEQCGKDFTDRIKFIIHLRCHTDKQYKCDGCLKMFKTAQARNVHSERFCKRIPCKYKCDRCNDRFHNKITLARHFHRFHSKVTTTYEPEIEYPCNQCSQTFNTPFGLTRHCQIHHPNVNPMMHSDSVSAAHFYQDANDNGQDPDYSPHSWEADDDDDDHSLLAAAFCEAELTEEMPTTSGITTDLKIKTLKRKGGKLCMCGSFQKYKSQKLCAAQKCACVKAGNRCNQDCNCGEHCVNQTELELEQQEKFREGKQNMMQTMQIEAGHTEYEDSTPIVIGYDDENDDEPPQPSSSNLGYHIPSSEFISLDGGDDESMRQLTMEGYVEGDEMDPLADPLSFGDEESSKVEKIKPANNPVVSDSYPILTKAISDQNVATPPASNVSFQIPDMESFNQSANLRCQFCKKGFKTVPSFVSHVLLHEVERANMQCPICKKEFQSQISTYMQHLDMHNKGVDLQCTKCTSKFKAYKDMEKHLKVHHFLPMECGICSLKFQNSQLMMNHWSKQHPTCQCGLCNVKYFSYDDLTFHMKSLHSPYDCLRCNQRFEKLEWLMDHFVAKHVTGSISQTSTSQHGVPQTKFKCNHCNETFMNGEDLNDHLSNHLSGLNQRGAILNYQCGQCSVTFTNAEDLHDHLAQHIMDTGPTPAAQHFTQNFPNVSSGVYGNPPASDRNIQVELVGEIDNDNIQAVETLTCPKCGKGFHNRNGWRCHITLSHKLLLCSACDSCFDSGEELQNHLKVNSCQVYFCEVCDRNFVGKRYLAQHEKIHKRQQQLPATDSTSNNQNQTLYSFGTSAQCQIIEDSPFPVIVASTSLAHPNVSAQSSAEMTEQYSNNSSRASPMQRTQPQREQSSLRTPQPEIEEIVLD